jgi:hypothetical protein
LYATEVPERLFCRRAGARSGPLSLSPRRCRRNVIDDNFFDLPPLHRRKAASGLTPKGYDGRFDLYVVMRPLAATGSRGNGNTHNGQTKSHAFNSA